jgi:hypothetical protein
MSIEVLINDLTRGKPRAASVVSGSSLRSLHCYPEESFNFTGPEKRGQTMGLGVDRRDSLLVAAFEYA